MSDDSFGAGVAVGRLRSLACQPFAMLLAYGVMAGAAFSISKLAMGAGVRPIAYTFWQIAGAAAVLLAIGLLRGDRFPVSRRHLAFSGNAQSWCRRSFGSIPTSTSRWSICRPA